MNGFLRFNMKPPYVSIIIPVFNHADELHACLASLATQTFRDFEVIIVDDGSTKPVDQTQFATSEFDYPVIWIHQDNQGAPSARNRGFRESASLEYVLFSDADITWEPQALEVMVSTLDHHPEVAYVYSSFYFGFKKFTCGAFSGERLKLLNFIHTSALIRRSVFPGFDESLKKFQDWDVWLTMAEGGKSGYWIDAMLFRIVPRASGMSQWLPQLLYKIPWLPLVKKYRRAEKIIRDKHHL